MVDIWLIIHCLSDIETTQIQCKNNGWILGGFWLDDCILVAKMTLNQRHWNNVDPITVFNVI